MSLYFGGKSDNLLNPALNRDEKPYKKLAAALGLSEIIFLQQTHGVESIAVARERSVGLSFFKEQGDLLFTNKKKSGLGIITADCLPLVLHDPVRHVGALVHAGWRGSLSSIASLALKKMTYEYSSLVTDIEVFFGPRIGSCCYEVDRSFVDRFSSYAFLDQRDGIDRFFAKRHGSYFFDLIAFNTLLLEREGVLKTAFNGHYSKCTACNECYASFRRDGPLSGRQASILILT